MSLMEKSNLIFLSMWDVICVPLFYAVSVVANILEEISSYIIV